METTGNGMGLLVFDAGQRLTAWNEAASALPALTGVLAPGLFRATLDPLLAGIPAMDRPLADGGLVRMLGPGASMTGTAGSRLFAAASHDLRQPLAALSLLMGALDGRIGDPAAREVMRAMGLAVDSMKTMVDGHLDLARLEAGLIDPDIGPHPVNGILTRLALEFAPRFEERRARFSVMPCSVMVETDPVLLERLLHALLSNALAHAGSIVGTEGGRSRVLLGCRRRGGMLSIGVWDTGRGLAPGPLSSLRQALEQPAADEGARVLGLGLTLARGLARRMGHRLTLESRAGSGTVFSVLVRRVPDSEEAAPLRPPPATPAPDISHTHVLIIEDDTLVREALQVLLGEWGCTVTGAESFDDAMTRIAPDGPPPELIIADLRLKGAANGIVAIRQIAKSLDRTVPGLILTGDTDPVRLKEARLSGYPLLHKPVSPLALRTALGNLLGRRTEREAT
ncbi:signal transduction histidine kinase/CheY-like chemotaxis protein [Azospirillum fermentarium]|uniref:hybrid sensor histidine kinase/response regulator n=1 Tax=Azospirillum fermentarium TaxID=1233114 RepID=UPI002227B203|nr:hybrid sensor histidine kinase/response regulator [Azospirillum fermentarium]MCW2247350.1 signal transduction histidine kinase/CheY-like chemotaxis protein [Azospirillum fermentarium]